MNAESAVKVYLNCDIGGFEGQEVHSVWRDISVPEPEPVYTYWW